MLSGLKARIQRKDKFENVDIALLTEKELQEFFGGESNSSRYLWNLALVGAIKKLLLEKEELRQVMELNNSCHSSEPKLPEHILVGNDLISTKTQQKVLTFDINNNKEICVMVTGASIWLRGQRAKDLAEIFGWTGSNIKD